MDVYKNIENVCIRSMRQEDLDEVKDKIKKKKEKGEYPNHLWGE